MSTFLFIEVYEFVCVLNHFFQTKPSKFDEMFKDIIQFQVNINQFRVNYD